MKKKGAIAGSIVDWYALIGFILMMILFYFLFSFFGKQREVVAPQDENIVFGQQLLNTYLKTTLTIEGKQRSISSIIEELATTKDSDTFAQKKIILASFTDDLFNHLSIGKYTLRVGDTDSSQVITEGTPKPFGGKPVVSGVAYHYSYLPSSRGPITVTLILYSYEAAIAETPYADTK